MDDGHKQPAAPDRSDRLQPGEAHGPAGELQCHHGPGKVNACRLVSLLVLYNTNVYRSINSSFYFFITFKLIINNKKFNFLFSVALHLAVIM